MLKDDLIIRISAIEKKMFSIAELKAGLKSKIESITNEYVLLVGAHSECCNILNEICEKEYYETK